MTLFDTWAEVTDYYDSEATQARIRIMKRDIACLVEQLGPEAWNGEETDSDRATLQQIDGIGREIERLERRGQ